MKPTEVTLSLFVGEQALSSSAFLYYTNQQTILRFWISMLWPNALLHACVHVCVYIRTLCKNYLLNSTQYESAWSLARREMVSLVFRLNLFESISWNDM